MKRVLYFLFGAILSGFFLCSIYVSYILFISDADSTRVVNKEYVGRWQTKDDLSYVELYKDKSCYVNVRYKGQGVAYDTAFSGYWEVQPYFVEIKKSRYHPDSVFYYRVALSATSFTDTTDTDLYLYIRNSKLKLFKPRYFYINDSNKKYIFYKDR